MALPTIPGSNCWTKAEDNVANLVSQQAATLLFLGVDTPQEARDGNMFIDTIGAPPETWDQPDWQAKFPNVLIGTPGDEAAGFTITPYATGGVALHAGIIEIRFSQFVDPLETAPNQERILKNHVGDMLVQMGHDGAMSLTLLSVVRYGRNPPDDWKSMGVIQSALTNIGWGSGESE